MGQLNSCGSNATACRVNEYALAHLQFCLGKEGIVGGHEDLWYACRLHKTQGFWYLDKDALLSQEEFSLPSTTCYAHDALPWLPQAHKGTNSINLTGKLKPGYVCR